MKDKLTQDVNIDQSTPLIDIATLNVVRLSRADSIGHAALLMAERRISCIIVTDDENHPVGILTEHDVLNAMQTGCPPDKAVSELMTSPVVTVDASISCLEAHQICLSAGIRHLVLTDQNKHLYGVVSETDFRLHMHLSTLAGRRQVSSAMSHAAYVLPPDTVLQEALNLMHARNCIVIAENNRPLGIITERDIVRFYSEKVPPSLRVDAVMSAPAITIPVNSSINDAAERMLTGKFRHLVVVDQDGCIAGLLSEHDLTQAMTFGLIDDKLLTESTYRNTLLNTVPDMVWLKDVRGVYLACNKRFERFFGAKEKAIIGRTDYDFVDSKLADFFRKHDRIAMETNGVSINEEWVTYADDGHKELLETIKTPMRDAAGKLLGVLGIARDITEHRNLEQQLTDKAEELQKSEEKLRTLLEAIPDAIQFKDGEGRWLESNSAALAAFGLDTSCLGKSDEELSHLVKPDYEASLLHCAESDKHAWLSGKSSRIEEVMHTPEGDKITFDVIKVPLYHADGSRKGLVIIGRDISELRTAQEIVAERERELRALTDNSPEAIVRYDKLCRRIFISPAHEKFTGIPAQALLGKSPVESWSLPSGLPGAQEFQKQLQKVLDSGEPLEWELHWQSTDEIAKCMLFRAVPEFDKDGQIISVLTLSGDISDRKEAENSLRLAASVFDNSQDAIVITNEDNLIIDVNPAFTQITDYSRDEVLGKNPRLLASGHQGHEFYAKMWDELKQHHAWRGEIWNRRKSGEIYTELLSISVINDQAGKVMRHVAVFSDISYLKRHEDELKHIAHYDALTGIPNRILLSDRMSQALAQAAREQEIVAICYLDLDHFKPVNDTFGHEAGDRVLIEVTKRISNTIRAGDSVARLGGDEFAILLRSLKDTEECVSTLERLLAAIAEPIEIGKNTAQLSASIGVTFFPLDQVDGATLLLHADQAMYLAKQLGKNRFYFYDAVLDSRARKHQELVESIRAGLSDSEFVLHYQPIINLETGKMISAEALIRWHHPKRGLLLPADFLFAIANTDLDIEIGDWVIARALDQIAASLAAGIEMSVSVNITSHHLKSARFTEKLQLQLSKHKELARGCLEIDLKELDTNDDALPAIIQACNKLGVKFALDDFGTGLSSLPHLSALPVGALKIDPSFVGRLLENDHQSAALVQSMIAITRAFSLQAAAEGIETEEQYLILKRLGCETGQGYAIASPMSAEQLADWRKTH